jgi:hypothetical protein
MMGALFAKSVVLCWGGVLIAACAAHQETEPPSAEAGKATDRGIVYGRLPACEPGQVAGDNGECLDVPADDRSGKTMREQLAERDCAQAAARVAATVARRQQVLAQPGHDVHLALNAIVSECTARENRLDLCERAGRYASDSPYRNEKIRQRDAVASCRELAALYRSMLAQGHRHAP